MNVRTFLATLVLDSVHRSSLMKYAIWYLTRAIRERFVAGAFLSALCVLYKRGWAEEHQSTKQIFFDWISTLPVVSISDITSMYSCLLLA
jgi:hypothetical protein